MLSGIGRLRFELQCVSDYGHEIMTIVEENGELADDPLDAFKGWQGDIHVKAALLLSSASQVLSHIEELETELNEAKREAVKYMRIMADRGAERGIAEQERDEARAEVERLKAELEAAKAQARYYRHLHDFETCTGCKDPDCGLCGPLNQ